eukprot:TRINITY_DN557_c0_g1_i1.p1 TRINITY_DN557_c0_g1~~TRINITY_DN557_c0_g1_i1.p1  ORF type:complete len:589 (+),score=147.82 TRINITY_DN557_c0_g1_i1:87-1853(+)
MKNIVLVLLVLVCIFATAESKKYTVNFRGLVSDICTDAPASGCPDPSTPPTPDCPDCPTVCVCPNNPSPIPGSSASSSRAPGSSASSSSAPGTSTIPGSSASSSSAPGTSPAPGVPSNCPAIPSPTPCPVVPTTCPTLPSQTTCPTCPTVCSPSVSPSPISNPCEVATTAIKVGLLFSESGYNSEADRLGLYGALFAIQQINSAGGLNLNSRVYSIEPVVVDPGTLPGSAWDAADSVIRQCGTTLFGVSSSSARRDIRTLVENRGALLIQGDSWEGAEISNNIVHTGSNIAQLVKPAVDYAVSQGRTIFYLLGSDDVESRTINFFLKAYLPTIGATVVGEDYVRLGITESTDDFVYPAMGDRMRNAARDAVCAAGTNCFMFINSMSGLAALRVYILATGARSLNGLKYSTLFLRAAEHELLKVAQQTNNTNIKNHFIAASYLDGAGSIDLTWKNDMKAFLTSVGGYPANTPLSALAVSSYYAVRLWAVAATAAGTSLPAVVKDAILTSTFTGPVGQWGFDAEKGISGKRALVGLTVQDAPSSIVVNPVHSLGNVLGNLYPAPPTQSQYQAFLTETFTNYGGQWELQPY